MRRKISNAIGMLRDGKEVSIKAFGPDIEKVIRMAEILKSRLGMLHQDTQFISHKRERSEDRKD